MGVSMRLATPHRSRPAGMHGIRRGVFEFGSGRKEPSWRVEKSCSCRSLRFSYQYKSLSTQKLFCVLSTGMQASIMKGVGIRKKEGLACVPTPSRKAAAADIPGLWHDTACLHTRCVEKKRDSAAEGRTAEARRVR